MRCVLEYSWMEKKISLSDQNIDWELFYKDRKWWLYRLIPLVIDISLQICFLSFPIEW